MTRLEKIQKIKELLAKKEGLTAEQRLRFGQIIAGEEKKELEAASALEPQNFEKRTQEEMATMGGSSDPLRGALMEEYAQDVAAGLTPEQIAQKNMQGMTQAVDIVTGAAPTRALLGKAMGADIDWQKALLQGVPSGQELVESSGRMQDSPLLRKATGFALDMADPGLLLGVGSLAKKGIQEAGESLYRSGMKNIDKMTWKAGKGKNAFSSTAKKYGIKGSAESIFEQTDEVLEKLLQERDSILAQASQKGAVVDADRVLKPVVKKAEALAKNKGVIDRNVKAQAANMAEDLKEFAEANKRIGEKAPIPEQVPAFFEQELPIKGTRTTRGTDLVVEGTPIATTQNIPAQTEALDLFEMAPQKETVGEAATLFNATPAAATDVSPQFSKWLERKGITPQEYQALAAQLDEVGNNAGWSFAADTPEGVRQFEMLSNTLGYEPDIVTSIYKQRQQKALNKLTGPYKTVDEAIQYELMSSGPGKKLATQVKEQPWTIQQGVAPIMEEQTTLLRPSDVMPPQQVVPASGGLTPTASSDVKTQLYNMMGSEPYGILRQDKKGQGLLKQAASRFNTATTEAVRKVDPQAAKRLRELNRDMGNLLTGRKHAWGEASKEITKNAVTSVDAPLAILNPQAYIGKKAADIAKGQAFRTVGGSVLSDKLVSSILGGGAALGAGATKAGLINAYKNREE